MSKAITTIADLTPDPANARRHPEANLTMIERGLREVGAARSIVIDERGVILAGNGVVEAAGQIGIEKVRVIDADGDTIIAVRRTGLSDEQKTRLALIDNRAGEMGEWDPDVLSGLLDAGGGELDGLFSPRQLDELVLAAARADEAAAAAEAGHLAPPVTPGWAALSAPPPQAQSYAPGTFVPMTDGGPVTPFAPNLQPTASPAPVTPEQVDAAGQRLDTKFAGAPTHLEVMCPHCAGQFFIDRNRV